MSRFAVINRTRCVAACLAAFCAGASLVAADEPRVVRDVTFAKVDNLELKLDFYLPGKPGESKPPLLVWVHGGAWRAGSKNDMPLGKLVARGFAVASVDYRLTPVARFPANVHDIKAAIRFARAKANDYGFDARRLAIVGASAGGHLAALVGVTNGHQELEGTVGEFRDQSSDVQAIVSLYGGSNLESILGQSTEFGLKVRVPALQLLLGGQPKEKPDLARLASPVAHVDDRDPPLLLIHGDADPQMPVEQSRELAARYEQQKRQVQLEIIPGAVHGGAVFFDDSRIDTIARFLTRTLSRGE